MGIESKAHVYVGDVRINVMTLSGVAGLKHGKGHFISRCGIIYVLLLSVQNLDRSDDDRFVVYGMDGITFLCKMLFGVAHNLFSARLA